MEPKSVVPAVAATAIGVSPSRRQRSSFAASSGTRRRLSRSAGTAMTASAPSPSSFAAFWTLKWPHSEVRMRSRDSSAPPASASSRASSRAWRLDWVPPLVKTPSAAGPRPILAAVQSISRRSISVAPALWSQVSSEELTALSTASAVTAGMTTGQLRWAR